MLGFFLLTGWQKRGEVCLGPPHLREKLSVPSALGWCKYGQSPVWGAQKVWLKVPTRRLALSEALWALCASTPGVSHVV